MSLSRKKDKRSVEEKKIDEQIEKLAMEASTPEDVDKVQRLIRNREEIKNCKKSKIDPNVVISGLVGIVQIGAIIKAEDLRVITSKALSFVHKGRLR